MKSVLLFAVSSGLFKDVHGDYQRHLDILENTQRNLSILFLVALAVLVVVLVVNYVLHTRREARMMDRIAHLENTIASLSAKHGNQPVSHGDNADYRSTDQRSA